MVSPKTDFIARIRALSSPLAPIPSGMAPRLDPVPARAVLFDVYGTLLVSACKGDLGTEAAIDDADAFHWALGAVGVPFSGELPAKRGVEIFLNLVQDAHARLGALGVERPEIDVRETWGDAFRILHREGRVERALAPEEAERFALEFECRANPVWPMPGAAETLRALRERGFVLGIVSNAQFFTPLVMEALLGAPMADLGFGADLCAWSYEHRMAKPSAGLYAPVLEALRGRFGIEAGEAAYVGNDMLNDVAGAARCGCRTVLFAGDRRSLRLREDVPECAATRPDAVVDSMGQLLGVLREA